MSPEGNEDTKANTPSPNRAGRTVRLCGLLGLAVAAVFGRLIYMDLDGWRDGPLQYLLHPGTITTAALAAMSLVAVIAARARSVFFLAAAAAAAGMYNLFAGAFQSIAYNESLGPWRFVMSVAVLFWSAWLAAILFPRVCRSR